MFLSLGKSLINQHRERKCVNVVYDFESPHVDLESFVVGTKLALWNEEYRIILLAGHV